MQPVFLFKKKQAHSSLICQLSYLGVSHVLSALWTLAAAAMKTHYFLLVMLFFLFSQMEPGKLWELVDGSGWDWGHKG